jgi:hypothetical protein
VGAKLVNGSYPDTRDQKYEYDNLHHLTAFDEGTLSGTSIGGKRGHSSTFS